MERKYNLKKIITKIKYRSPSSSTKLILKKLPLENCKKKTDQIYKSYKISSYDKTFPPSVFLQFDYIFNYDEQNCRDINDESACPILLRILFFLNYTCAIRILSVIKSVFRNAPEEIIQLICMIHNNIRPRYYFDGGRRIRCTPVVGNVLNQQMFSVREASAMISFEIRGAGRGPYIQGVPRRFEYTHLRYLLRKEKKTETLHVD